MTKHMINIWIKQYTCCIGNVDYGQYWTVYQSMLAMAKKTDYAAYDPSTCIHHFLNVITNPAFALAKLSLEANHKHYSGDFDATV